MTCRRVGLPHGSALFEVVVAMVVFSTGLLGVLQMQYFTTLVWHGEQQRVAARRAVRQIADEISLGLRPVSGRSQHAWGDAQWSPVADGVEVIASMRLRAAGARAAAASDGARMSEVRLWIALPATGPGAR